MMVLGGMSTGICAVNQSYIYILNRPEQRI